MGKRTTARKLAMQTLYQSDLSGASIDKILSELSSRENYLEETLGFAKKLSVGAWKEKASADASITKLSKHWTMERMGKVVVSVLRLAIYELEHERDTPKSVVINEAVELTKKFSGDEAAKFVNGILGAFLKEQELCSQG